MTGGNGPRLASLGGEVAPEGFASDLARLADLSEDARRDLWSVLGPSLPDVLEPRLESALGDFAARYGVPDADLAHGLKAARFLVRSAAKLNVTFDAARADLDALLDDERAGPLIRALEPRWNEAVRTLRGELVRGALTEHGALLTASSWRLDAIVACERAVDLAAPVVLLTLRYRAHGEERAMTLQALPDEIEGLKRALDAALQAIASRTQ